jgi:uncharacterized protein YabE (DUF348 family)
MKPIYRWLVPAGMLLMGIGLLMLGLYQPVPMSVDGKAHLVRCLAPSVGGILHAIDMEPGPYDRVQPDPASLLLGRGGISIWRSRVVAISSPLAGIQVEIPSSEPLAGNLLAQVGLRLYPGDVILANGEAVSPDDPLTGGEDLSLELLQAQQVQLVEDGSMRVLYSAASTVGEALLQAGIQLGEKDRLSPPPETPLTGYTSVLLHRAKPIQFEVAGQVINALSAAETIGQALADAGISLQGLDFSKPAEDQPPPSGRPIRVVRVREEIILEQSPLPFAVEEISDPALALGQSRVVEAGVPGVQARLIRVVYQNGVEISREQEAEWVASPPIPQTTGLGTMVVSSVVDSPYGPLEYYRSVTVYATSYSPCNLGTDTCHDRTASGAPVSRGIIGVTRPWYQLFAGQRVYVPGYGIAVIGDIGGGVAGRYWIDLGFTDEEYEHWSRDVTLYFLTPAPANVPAVLP